MVVLEEEADPAFGGIGWQGWGVPSWECKSPKTNSPFVGGMLGDSVPGISCLSVGEVPFLPSDFWSEGMCLHADFGNVSGAGAL